MILTADHLAIISKYLEDNKEKLSGGRLQLPNLSKELTLLFNGKIYDVYFYNHGRDPEACISIRREMLGVTAYNWKDGFIWEASFYTGGGYSAKIDDIIPYMDEIKIFHAKKAVIQEIIERYIPECNQFTLDRIKWGRVSWAMDNIQKLYSNFVPVDSEKIDTDACLKQLRKEKIEEWPNGFIYRSDKKNEIINRLKESIEIAGQILEEL